MASAETSSSLLIRIRDPQDSQSWNLFVDVYTPVVYRYLVKRGLQDADATDCTQDSLIEVARCIQSFEYRPEIGRFRDWLALVVRRRLYRFWNQRRHEGLDECSLPGNGADSEWIEVYQSELLRAAIERVRQEVEEKMLGGRSSWHGQTWHLRQTAYVAR